MSCLVLSSLVLSCLKKLSEQFNILITWIISIQILDKTRQDKTRQEKTRKHDWMELHFIRQCRIYQRISPYHTIVKYNVNYNTIKQNICMMQYNKKRWERRRSSSQIAEVVWSFSRNSCSILNILLIWFCIFNSTILNRFLLYCIIHIFCLIVL